MSENTVNSSEGVNILYVIESCPRCECVKKRLKFLGISFKTVTITVDIVAEWIMQDRFFLSAPILCLDGKYYLDDQLDELLGIR